MADARTEARSQFRRGMSLISNGKYDEGIASLKEAHNTLPHPNVLFNIARAYVEKGDLENAVFYYGQYVEQNPPDKDEVEAVVAALEQRLLRQRATRVAAESAGAVPVAPEAPAPVASGAPAAGSPGGPTAPGPGQPAPSVPMPGAHGAPAALGAPGPQPSPSELRLGAEKQEDVYEESVVSASKGTALSPLDAPNSVTIITEQDIRLSGMTNIADLLRRVAGIDIIDVSNGQQELSMRGFNQRMSNKLLVLIDGRSAQIEFFGSTFWNWFGIDVDQIERIEVVRGPGSALYGADAFTGVVNIVTRPPGTGRGAIRLGGGPSGEAYGSLRAVGRSEALAYRMSVGYARAPKWSRDVGDQRVDIRLGQAEQNLAAENVHFDFRSDRRLGPNVRLGLSGGYANYYDNFYAIGIFRGFDQRGFGGYAQANLQAHQLSVRSHFNFDRLSQNGSTANYIGQTQYSASLGADVFDTELVFADEFTTGAMKHGVNLGFNYKYRHVESTFTQTANENFFGFFGQESLTVSPALVFIASGRLDYLPYTEKWEVSPRVSALVHPSERSTIRGTFSTAFRKPTALEGYMQLPVQSTSGAVQSFNDTLRYGDLQPERILATELGYINQELDWLSVDTAAYYNRVTDLVILAPNVFATPSDRRITPLFDQGTGRYTAAFSAFANQCAAFNVYGGEVGVRVYPIAGFDVFANYAYNDTVIDRPPGCNDPADRRTSHHKINAGVQVRTKPGVDGEITLNYVSDQVWSERVVSQAGDIVSEDFPLPSYTLLNARLGYRFIEDRFEVSATAFNILNDKHQEHPFTQVVGQRFMGFAHYSF
ncbi:MAG: TonB-dependent receptor [Polyangiaceae bacterium]|nr:TonB-dependent receptor [Polyangiaceae bacterium]